MSVCPSIVASHSLVRIVQSLTSRVHQHRMILAGGLHLEIIHEVCWQHDPIMFLHSCNLPKTTCSNFSLRMLDCRHCHHKLFTFAEVIKLVGSILIAFKHVCFQSSTLFLGQKVLNNVFDFLCHHHTLVTESEKRTSEMVAYIRYLASTTRTIRTFDLLHQPFHHESV